MISQFSNSQGLQRASSKSIVNDKAKKSSDSSFFNSSIGKILNSLSNGKAKKIEINRGEKTTEETDDSFDLIKSFGFQPIKQTEIGDPPQNKIINNENNNNTLLVQNKILNGNNILKKEIPLIAKSKSLNEDKTLINNKENSTQNSGNPEKSALNNKIKRIDDFLFKLTSELDEKINKNEIKNYIIRNIPETEKLAVQTKNDTEEEKKLSNKLQTDANINTKQVISFVNLRAANTLDNSFNHNISQSGLPKSGLETNFSGDRLNKAIPANKNFSANISSQKLISQQNSKATDNRIKKAKTEYSFNSESEAQTHKSVLDAQQTKKSETILQSKNTVNNQFKPNENNISKSTFDYVNKNEVKIQANKTDNNRQVDTGNKQQIVNFKGVSKRNEQLADLSKQSRIDKFLAKISDELITKVNSSEIEQVLEERFFLADKEAILAKINNTSKSKNKIFNVDNNFKDFTESQAPKSERKTLFHEKATVPIVKNKYSAVSLEENIKIDNNNKLRISFAKQEPLSGNKTTAQISDANNNLKKEKLTKSATEKYEKQSEYGSTRKNLSTNGNTFLNSDTGNFGKGQSFKSADFEQNTTENQLIPNIRLEDFDKTTLKMVRNLPEQGIQNAKLILQPKSLGTVFVKISVKDKNVQLDIKTETQEAMKSIENQLPALKEKLAQQGLTADRVDLKYKGTDNNFAERDNYAQNQSGAKQDKETRQQYLRSFASANQSIANNEHFDEIYNVKNWGNYIEELQQRGVQQGG